MGCLVLKWISVHDKSIYKYLTNTSCYYGVFQCEEGTGKEVLLKIKPINVDEIAVAIALSRPGCIKFVDDYINNKTLGHFETDPRIRDILLPTHGIIVYQEQIMQLCVRMASFTPQESDGVRKAVGKKLLEKMRSYKEQFISKSIANGFNPDLVAGIWQVFEDSGNYLFNASHAAGYSYLTAITAYLKANHPKEFYLSLLIYSQNETKPLE